MFPREGPELFDQSTSNNLERNAGQALVPQKCYRTLCSAPFWVHATLIHLLFSIYFGLQVNMSLFLCVFVCVSFSHGANVQSFAEYWRSELVLMFDHHEVRVARGFATADPPLTLAMLIFWVSFMF